MPLISISSLYTITSFNHYNFRYAVLNDRCRMEKCDFVDRCTYDALKCRQVKF